VQSDPFLTDINDIRNDLGIIPPPPPVFGDVKTFSETPIQDLDSLPAQNLANLSSEQIQNDTGLSDYVQVEEAVDANSSEFTMENIQDNAIANTLHNNVLNNL